MADKIVYVVKDEKAKTVTAQTSATIPDGAKLLLAQTVLPHETALQVAGYVADKFISTKRTDWTVTAA